MTEIVHASDLAGARAAVRERTGDVLVAWPGIALADLVEVMQSDPRVAGVVAGKPPAALEGGVEHAVRDAADASACLAALDAYLAERGVRVSLRTAVVQTADELVTNALFDAPVDVHGAPLFAGVPARARKRMRTDRRVQVRYVETDGKVVLAVADTFGSLRRATVLRHLYKCVHTERPVDTRSEGAGVGLYLALTSATALVCEVTPQRSTEITATFEDGRHASALVFITHPEAPQGTPARVERLPDRRRTRVLALAVGAIVLVGAVVFAMRDAPVVPLSITSEPPGAMVRVAGRAVGTTPLVYEVEEGRLDITWELVGFLPAAAHRLEVADTRRVHRVLAPDPRRARVRLISDPPGAVVLPTGSRPGTSREFTPATIDVPAGMTQRFTLEMPGYVPEVITPFVVEAGQIVERTVTLQRAP